MLCGISVSCVCCQVDGCVCRSRLGCDCFGMDTYNWAQNTKSFSCSDAHAPGAKAVRMGKYHG